MLTIKGKSNSKKPTRNIKEKYKALFILHGLGDTIGFKNGEWEIMRKDVTLDIVNEFIYQFITLGGVNGIDLTDWNVSDDTLYHMATAKAMLKYDGKIDANFNKHHKLAMLDIFKQIDDEENKKGINIRYTGYTTDKYIEKFTDKTDASHQPYDPESGGNGCAMKMLCVGACLHKKDQLNELIDVSIRIGKMTHNSPIGFLGGLNSALFTMFAIEGVPISKWGFELIKILSSKQVKKHVDFESLDEMNDYLTFIKQWKKYLKSRFKEGKLVITKSHTNMMLRIKYYHELLVKTTSSDAIGESGFGACIMAYDCLLDSGGYWEKLIMYSGMHPGDSDTTCAIAGGWFGAIYGFSDTPKNLIEKLEYVDKLKNLGRDIYEKYH